LPPEATTRVVWVSLSSITHPGQLLPLQGEFVERQIVMSGFPEKNDDTQLDEALLHSCCTAY
jgi:hypothetical protein